MEHGTHTSRVNEERNFLPRGDFARDKSTKLNVYILF